MSIFLHGAKPSSQILPEEKRVNRDHFGTKIDKGGTFGEQMLMFLSNYESLDRDISHRLCKSPPKKASFFKIVCSPKLLPQLANIFTRINPSYPWHFASLSCWWCCWVLGHCWGKGQIGKIFKRLLVCDADFWWRWKRAHLTTAFKVGKDAEKKETTSP